MPKTKPLAKTNQLQTSYKMEPHSLCSSVEISRQHINTIIDLISPYHHCFTLLLVASLAATLFYACRRKAPIYLIDFNCYCPPSSYRLPLAMLIFLSNCLFRMGGSAILMSSRVQDMHKAKYKLQHIVRTITAQDDQSHGCVYQQVDPENKEGISISKNIVNVSGDALKKNIASLGPLVLPLKEQFLYLFSIIRNKIWSARKISMYTPNFNHAFEHFCIHSGGRAIIQAVERNLRLRKQDVEPSTMTLYRFGNISSSSIWYELSYIEAKGRMKCGDRVWQIAFGSGFKCNSAVWKCVCDVKPDTATAWRDTIHSYPVDIVRTN
ncbi:hypothetical protein AAZV13_09G041200 [Glycine max]|uniref:very-long-chain 3-oxoacyl-CoA synthase n=2 Tax=Glycine max TaxID=3847 RepID=K7LBS0_SOYBN